jgi:hypothetical protein
LLVAFDSFPLGYEVLIVNLHDSRKHTIVATIEGRHAPMGRAWITDRGMVSAPDRINRHIGRLSPPEQALRRALGHPPWKRFRGRARFRLSVDVKAKLDDWAQRSEDTYVLRSNITGWTREQL